MVSIADRDTEGTGLRVLIVEDERRLGDMLSTALRDMDCRPALARSAEQAMGLLERSAHDVVLLDLRLPGMGGLEFLDVLRQRWPAAAVIIMTGHGDLEAARRAIRSGVVDFLTKPASLGDIEQSLERARLRLASCPQPATPPGPEPIPDPGPASAASHSLEAIEREHILKVLDLHKGNRSAAAAALGISLRTLYYRLAEYQRDGHVA
jgi:DNA-binding NtrC family response regulator